MTTALAKRLLTHQERYRPVEVTLLWLDPEESVVSLATWLGHSDPAFTLRTYTHCMPQAGARGLAAVEDLLGDAD